MSRDRYRRARKGYKYALTALGLTISHVRAKHNKSHRLYNYYQHYALNSWLEKGYVEEVKEIAEEES